MLHLDFNWDLSPLGILLDEELNTERLGWKPGDVFVIEKTDSDRLFIKKQTGVTKFVLEGLIEKDRE